MSRQSYMPQSKRQEHISPDRVFDIISDRWDYNRTDFYDPCPPGTPYKAPIFFNGLYGDWMPLNYVNPPFVKPVLERFVQKAYDETKKGHKTVMLCPTKTDQDWFHDIILKNNFEIQWIRRRLKFKNDMHHATDTHFLVMIR